MGRSALLNQPTFTSTSYPSLQFSMEVDAVWHR